MVALCVRYNNQHQCAAIFMMKYLRNRYFLLADLLLLPLVSYLSYALRLGRLDLSAEWNGVVFFALMETFMTVVVFWKTAIYTRRWSEATAGALLLLTGANAVSAFLTGSGYALVGSLLPGGRMLPWSVPFISFILAVGATAGPRLALRLVASQSDQRWHRERTRSIPVAIAGAGEAGAMIADEIERNPQYGLRVVGFLDDAPDRSRNRSFPLVGSLSDIPHLADQRLFRQVIIALPTASGDKIREIVKICRHARVPTRMVPILGLYGSRQGRLPVNQIRPLHIEDLLRQETGHIDIASIEALVCGKRVLVVGCDGAIGGELCRQIVRCNPDTLIIAGEGENRLFETAQELQQMVDASSRRKNNGANGTNNNNGVSKIVPVMTDARFQERIQKMFATHRPHVVFHAASYRHVSLMEMNLSEAVATNILATHNLIQASLATRVERFILLSTDRTATPTTVVGVTMRVAEMLVARAAANSGNPYVVLQMGDFLHQREHILRMIKQQVESGGPVTVPNIHFPSLTLPEATLLVLQAAMLGRGGVMFRLGKGEMVYGLDLVRDMILLGGRDREIEVVFPGSHMERARWEEKRQANGNGNHQTNHKATNHKATILLSEHASPIAPPDIEAILARLNRAVWQNNRDELCSLLQTLVPGHQPALQGKPPAEAGGLPSPEGRASGEVDNSPRLRRTV